MASAAEGAAPGATDVRARALLVLVIALAALVGADYIFRTSVVVGGTRTFLLWDDAMISMQYAKNWVAGDGLVWSAGGERVQGFSNPGVTLVMAAIHCLPLAPGHFALAIQALNLALLAAIAALTFELMQRGIGPDPARSTTAAAGAAFCFPLVIYALQGSDAGFVCAWLLLCHRVLLRGAARGEGVSPWLAPLFAVGIVLRLDSAIFLLPFAAVAATLPGPKLRRAIPAAAILAGTVGGLLLFGQLYYGDPLPNTYYLKATGQPRELMLWHGLLQLLHWGAWWAPLLLLAGVAAVRERRRPFVRLAVGCIAVAVAYHVWVGGDLQPRYGSRFLLPVLPLLACLGAAGAWQLAETGLGRRSRRVRSAAAALVALPALALANSGATTREVLGRGADTMLAPYNRQNLASAFFYRDHTRPRTTIALHWAGAIAYFSERPVVDVLGKSDRHIARLVVDRFSPGHSKWDWDYVVNVLRPDIVNAESRGLLQRPDFRRLYARADPPQAPYFYIRRDRLRRVTDGETKFTRLDPIPPGS